jgi:class 3 adenylate cyclase/tetratricopeptide (TPR) repeat protein
MEVTPRESRRTVTVLFCDVAGFTTLAEEIDPEALRFQMKRYFAAAERIVQSHGGTVEKFIGDAVMAVFGLPTMHEDDGVRALRAAAELRDAFGGSAALVELPRLRVRIGVCTGKVIAGEAGSGQAFVTGDAVNVAARLQQAAEPGEIYLSQATAALAREAAVMEPVGQLELKGKRGPVAALRLVSVAPVSQELRPQSAAALVGRTDELAQLQAALDRATQQRRPHLVTIVGAPGVGKSRLVAELATRSKAPMLRGRCLPYGEAITYWPLLEIVQAAANVADDQQEATPLERLAQRLAGQSDGALIASQLAATVGWTDSLVPPEETAWAVRRFLEAEASDGPLMVVIDDFQWAEPALLDVVEHVVDWARDAPVLLVCIGRLEFLDVRPTWGVGKINATALLLEPLPGDGVRRMVEQLLESVNVPGPLMERIAVASNGLPLFIEQIVQLLVDRGHLLREDGVWRSEVEIGALPIPSTITALLDARVDGLPVPEKALLATASVIGEEFEIAPLASVSGMGEASVNPLVVALMRRELIHRDTRLSTEGAYRFRHLLVRDAAYNGLSKANRAALHTGFANWLTQTRPEGAGELAEIIGYHLESAHRYRAELGLPVDAELALRAREHLVSAAVRAQRRKDWAAASNLLGRALRVEPITDRTLMELLGDLGEVRLEMGDYDAAGQAIDQGIRVAQNLGDPGAEIRLRTAHARTRRATRPEEGLREARELLGYALPILEERVDEQGLGAFYELQAEVAYYEGRIGDALLAVETALAHARRADDDIRAQGLANFRIQLATEHLPVASARSFSEARLAEVESGSLTYAMLLANDGLLTAKAGDYGEACRLLDQAAAIHGGVAASQAFKIERDIRSRVEWLNDNLPAAEKNLREVRATLEAEGEKFYAATYAALLAQVVAEQGRTEEALELAAEADQLAASDDEWVRMIGCQARALIAAQQGASSDAVELAAEAVRIAESMDLSSMRISAFIVQAVVLADAGHRDDALSAVRQARAIAMSRGSVAEAQRADRIAERL